MGSNEPDPIHSNLFSYTVLQVLHIQMDTGQPLPGGCQGQWNHLNVPQEQRGQWPSPVAHPHQDLNHGAGFDPCFLWCLAAVRYRVPKFPHSSATFNIILGSCILASPEVLQGSLGDSTCPMQCSQPYPMPANRHLTGLTWFPIVLNYIK